MDYDWKNKQILIVEDEDMNYILIREVLKKTNATIFWAENGKIAVDIFSQHSNIDLVLMDLKMPVMNGFEATSLIKQIRANVPVIAQTAYAMSGDREKILQNGCNDYIAKPIIPQRLLFTISKYI